MADNITITEGIGKVVAADDVSNVYYQRIKLVDGTLDSTTAIAAGGTTCGMQGTVTATAGGGDMTLDNTSIVAGQTVTITTFALTDANA